MVPKEKIKPFSLEGIISKQLPAYPEYPVVDNNDWLRTNYTSFYKRQMPSETKLLLFQYFPFLKTGNNKFFSLHYFKELLDNVTKHRELSGYTPTTVVKIVTNPEMRFFIWGDVQGALHSLLRTLAKLKEDAIIDDSLKILSPNYYLVFLGDVIDRSAYSIETLTLVLQLMAVNDDQVVYIRGNHESRSSWEEFDFGKALRIRARHLSSEDTPFQGIINRFFDTLPYQLFLQTMKNRAVQFVRLSHERDRMALFEEHKFSDFLLGKNNGIYDISTNPLNLKVNDPILSEQKFKEFAEAQNNTLVKYDISKLKKNLEVKRHIFLSGIICSERSSMHLRFTNGLRPLTSEKGVTVWSPLSSPTSAYQELIGFYNDSFCRLDTIDNVEQWILNHFRRDVRSAPHFTTKSYHFTTTALIPDDAEEAKKLLALLNFQEDIIAGCTLDLSKTSKTAGKRLKHGIGLRINKENMSGGIRGKELKVIFLDDKYAPVEVLKNVTSFLEDYHTDILLSPLGAPTNEVLIPLLKEKKVCALFPYTGLDLLRDSALPNVFHFRPAYKHEINALLHYAIETLHLNRFAILYQEDAYGFGALDGAREAFNNYGIKTWLEVGYSRNTLNIDPAVEKTLEFNPQAIIFIATYAPAAAFVHKIGVSYLFDKVCLGFSFLTDSFRYFMNKNGLNFIITRVVPAFTDDEPLAIVREYLDEQIKLPCEQNISWDSLEGYINASIYIEVLKQIPDPVTKEKIVAYLENLSQTDFKGLQLNFDSATRGFSNNLLIDTGTELIPWGGTNQQTNIKLPMVINK